MSSIRVTVERTDADGETEERTRHLNADGVTYFRTGDPEATLLTLGLFALALLGAGYLFWTRDLLVAGVGSAVMLGGLVAFLLPHVPPTVTRVGTLTRNYDLDADRAEDVSATLSRAPQTTVAHESERSGLLFNAHFRRTFVLRNVDGLRRDHRAPDYWPPALVGAALLAVGAGLWADLLLVGGPMAALLLVSAGLRHYRREPDLVTVTFASGDTWSRRLDTEDAEALVTEFQRLGAGAEDGPVHRERKTRGSGPMAKIRGLLGRGRRTLLVNTDNAAVVSTRESSPRVLGGLAALLAGGVVGAATSLVASAALAGVAAVGAIGAVVVSLRSPERTAIETRGGRFPIEDDSALDRVRQRAADTVAFEDTADAWLARTTYAHTVVPENLVSLRGEGLLRSVAPPLALAALSLLGGVTAATAATSLPGPALVWRALAIGAVALTLLALRRAVLRALSAGAVVTHWTGRVRRHPLSPADAGRLEQAFADSDRVTAASLRRRVLPDRTRLLNTGAIALVRQRARRPSVLGPLAAVCLPAAAASFALVLGTVLTTRAATHATMLGPNAVGPAAALALVVFGLVLSGLWRPRRAQIQTVAGTTHAVEPDEGERLVDVVGESHRVGELSGETQLALARHHYDFSFVESNLVSLEMGRGTPKAGTSAALALAPIFLGGALVGVLSLGVLNQRYQPTGGALVGGLVLFLLMFLAALKLLGLFARDLGLLRVEYPDGTVARYVTSHGDADDFGDRLEVSE